MKKVSSVFNHIPVDGGTVGSVRLSVDNGNKNIPMVLINGGPGGTFLDENHSLGKVAPDRDVILYDQLGSLHSPAKFDMSLTPIERFVAELKAVLDYYGIEKANILGHSFGGTVAADFVLTHPDRVHSVMFSSPLLSTPRWIEDANYLLSQLPEKERDIIQRKLSGEDIDDEIYNAAEKVFYYGHVCRLDPWPERMKEGFANGNKEIYRAMWGISEFTCTGTLKNYDRLSDLKAISMPALFTCGRYDEARPETIEEAAKSVKGALFHVFEHSSHLPIWEEPAEFIGTVRGFFKAQDTAPGL